MPLIKAFRTMFIKKGVNILSNGKKAVNLQAITTDGSYQPSHVKQRIKSYNVITMKKDLHPSNYREVVFKDMSNDQIFITRSTVNTRETIVVDGKEYPLLKLEITSASHPFFTGKQKLVDTAGRVDKFMNRYGNRGKK